MKLKLLLLIAPLLVSGDNLKELIDFATIHNDLVIAKNYTLASKAKEVESKQSAYFPTVDIGGFYQRDDEASPFQAGDVYSGFAKVGLDIYDGGKKSSQIEQSRLSLLSSTYDKKAYKKSLALQITEDFFTIKSLESTLNTREEANKSLKAQLQRITRFYEAKMATKDDVDRVQADFDTNIYNMESIKFQILSLKSQLELKVGKRISSLEKSSFIKNSSKNYKTLDSAHALISQKSSIQKGASAIDSFYYPNLRVEDTYSLYGYERIDPNLIALNASPLDKQNTLLLTLNLRVFDYGNIAKTKEAVLLNAQALEAQILYQTKEQKVQYELSIARIKTANARIKSALSALNAATSAFETIEKKYNAGIVDYIVYLDSLTKKTNSKALYESGLNDLEIAYATLYYYEAKDITEELQ
ncbi:MAG: TolC family protein [Sulfurimonas sp.]